MRLLMLVGLSAQIVGCAVSLRGAVRPDDDGRPVLHLAEGGTRRLLLPPQAAPLAGLDGEGVRIEGRRGLTGVTVLEIITDALQPGADPDGDIRASHDILTANGWKGRA